MTRKKLYCCCFCLLKFHLLSSFSRILKITFKRKNNNFFEKQKKQHFDFFILFCCNRFETFDKKSGPQKKRIYSSPSNLKFLFNLNLKCFCISDERQWKTTFWGLPQLCSSPFNWRKWRSDLKVDAWSCHHSLTWLLSEELQVADGSMAAMLPWNRKQHGF